MHNENDVVHPLILYDDFKDYGKAKSALLALVYDHGEDAALSMCADSLRQGISKKKIWFVESSKGKTELMDEIIICNAMAAVFNPIDIVIAFRAAGIKEHVINVLLSEVKL